MLTKIRLSGMERRSKSLPLFPHRPPSKGSAIRPIQLTAGALTFSHTLVHSQTKEPLKNPSLDYCILRFVKGTSLYHYSKTGSEKRSFRFPSFSIAYSD